MSEEIDSQEEHDLKREPHNVCKRLCHWIKEASAFQDIPKILSWRFSRTTAISWDTHLNCVLKGDPQKTVVAEEFFTKKWASLLLRRSLKRNKGKTGDKQSGPFPWVGWLQAEEDARFQQGKEAHPVGGGSAAMFCAPQGSVHEQTNEASCIANAEIFQKMFLPADTECSRPPWAAWRQS